MGSNVQIGAGPHSGHPPRRCTPSPQPRIGVEISKSAPDRPGHSPRRCPHTPSTQNWVRNSKSVSDRSRTPRPGSAAPPYQIGFEFQICTGHTAPRYTFREHPPTRTWLRIFESVTGPAPGHPAMEVRSRSPHAKLGSNFQNRRAGTPSDTSAVRLPRTPPAQPKLGSKFQNRRRIAPDTRPEGPHTPSTQNWVRIFKSVPDPLPETPPEHPQLNPNWVRIFKIGTVPAAGRPALEVHSRPRAGQPPPRTAKLIRSL
jgi:hypothetical protein